MNRLLSRRPSASMLVACVALFVAMGGVGYAAATIDSGDIVNNTVRSQDLRNGGVLAKDIKKDSLGGGRIKESKLGQVPSAADAAALGGAPAADYLKTAARGVAQAGAVVKADGTVLSWFNRAGGAPSVTHSSEGDYNVTFPGVAVATGTHLAGASVVGILGIATPDYSGGKVHVRTFTGNLAADTWDEDDRTFTVLLHAASTTG
jgi:hypothetical protein